MGSIIKLLAAALVILQAGLLAMLTVTGLSSQYFTQLGTYLADSPTITIPASAADNSALNNTLLSSLHAGKVIVRKDPLLNQVDGGIVGYRIGFAGDAASHPDKFGLSFLGTPVFTAENLTQLLRAEQVKTLGLDVSAVETLAPLPSISGGTRVVAMHLAELQQSSATIAGTYYFVGYSEQELTQLRAQLARQLGTQPAALSEAANGGGTQENLFTTLLPVGLAVTWCALAFLLFIGLHIKISQLGNYLLLGWSRAAYASKVLRPLVIVSLFSPLLGLGIVCLMLRDFQLNLPLLSAGFTAGAGAVPLTLLACAAAAVALYQFSPVAAIRGRLKSRLLSLLIALAYLGATVFCCVATTALDGPLREVANLQQVREKWQEYSSLRLLYRENAGANSTAFGGADSSHAAEFFKWYAAIADKPGVYLAHSEYYDAATLRGWQGLYEQVPQQPFWQLAASPNYLREHGFRVSQTEIAAARQGVRVVFIPATLPLATKEQLRGYLTEYDTALRDTSIHNSFSRNPQMRFVEYTPETPLFTWNTDLRLPHEVADPVITLLTPQNMIPLESESLYATGLANSYIKLTAQAAKQYLRPEFLARFGLDDNKPEFLPVRDYVAGLHKRLGETIALFGGVIGLLGGLQLLLVAALVQLYAANKREQIAARRLLGHPLTRVFLPPLLFVAGVASVAALCLAGMRSTSGVVTLLLLGVAAVVLMLWQGRASSRRLLAQQLKE